ncbi:MAG: hypothetical protein JWO15_3533 [Sphingomonadales bacterium]|nr:hypothetical protein [Sphingomonadales bacterium]
MPAICNASFITIESPRLLELCAKARAKVEDTYEPQIKPYRDAYAAELAKFKSRSKFAQRWLSPPYFDSYNEGWWLTRGRDENLKKINTIQCLCLFADVVNLSIDDMNFIADWAGSTE